MDPERTKESPRRTTPIEACRQPRTPWHERAIDVVDRVSPSSNEAYPGPGTLVLTCPTGRTARRIQTYFLLMEDEGEGSATDVASDPVESGGFYDFRQHAVDVVFARLRAAQTRVTRSDGA